MPRVRAVKSFVWHGRDVDVGDEFDATEREAFLLVHAYRDAVVVGGEAPAVPRAMVVQDADPAVEHRDPVRPPKGRRP